MRCGRSVLARSHGLGLGLGLGLGPRAGRRQRTARARWAVGGRRAARAVLSRHLAEVPRASGRAVLVCARLLRRKNIFYFYGGAGGAGGR